ncbi:hypothetical protein SLA2020_493240 [Shorea laevis]
MQQIRYQLGFDCLFTVDPRGTSGGLALLWKYAPEVQIQNFSRWHISAVITSGTNSIPWKFTGFYGDPDRAGRDASWSLLTHLNTYGPSPWLCVGDFNEIIDQSEKIGGALRSERQMENFRVTLETCGLTDLGYSGPHFTWSNCRDAGQLIHERLDRATANLEWCNQFTNVEVSVLAAISSDHHPLLVCYSKKRRRRRRPRLFRFEESWNTDRECAEVVKRAWVGCISGGTGFQSVKSKLQHCKQALTGWSSSNFEIHQRSLLKKPNGWSLSKVQQILRTER